MPTVTVYDSRGRRVQRLFDALTDAEEQSLVWSPKGLASGVYLVQVSSGGGSAVAKISLIE